MSDKQNTKIKIIIENVEISITVIFNLKCLTIMSKNYEHGDTYRNAFAKAIFYMPWHTTTNDITKMIEQDFVKISNDNLFKIVNIIINNNKYLETKYNATSPNDPFEFLFNSLKESIDTITNKLSKIATSQIEYLNTTINRIAINMETILSPLNQLSEQFNKLFSTLEIDYEPLLEFKHHIQESFNKFNLQTYNYFHNYFYNYFQEYKDNIVLLKKYDWIYTQEIPNNLIENIRANEDNLDTKMVNELILNYFEYYEV